MICWSITTAYLYSAFNHPSSMSLWWKFLWCLCSFYIGFQITYFSFNRFSILYLFKWKDIGQISIQNHLDDLQKTSQLGFTITTWSSLHDIFLVLFFIVLFYITLYYLFVSYLYTFFVILLKIREGVVLDFSPIYNTYIQYGYPVRIPIHLLYSFYIYHVPSLSPWDSRFTLDTDYSEICGQ